MSVIKALGNFLFRAISHVFSFNIKFEGFFGFTNVIYTAFTSNIKNSLVIESRYRIVKGKYFN